MGYLILLFRRRQGALGRFRTPAPLPDGQEQAWLEQYLLPLRAEEVGAMWDRTIGPPEVAALIARWVAEGKVRSRVEESSGFLGLGKERILHLELIAGRDAFTGYELTLLNKFFFRGDTTDTKRLREYYKGSGFDPAGALREGLESRLASRPGWQEKANPAPDWKPTGLLFLAGLGCLVADFFVGTEAAFFSGFFFFFPLIPTYIIAAIVASVQRKRVQKVQRGMFWVAPPAGPLLGWVGLFAVSSPMEMDPTMSWSPGYFALLGYGLLAIGIIRSVFNIASSRESEEGVSLRRWLASARNYFAGELRREKSAVLRRDVPLPDGLRARPQRRRLVPRLRRGRRHGDADGSALPERRRLFGWWFLGRRRRFHRRRRAVRRRRRQRQLGGGGHLGGQRRGRSVEQLLERRLLGRQLVRRRQRRRLVGKPFSHRRPEISPIGHARLPLKGGATFVSPCGYAFIPTGW